MFDDVGPNGYGFDSGVLDDNGGPVQTIAIFQGGVAQDAGIANDLPLDAQDLDGDSELDEPLPVDARGELRVAGPSVDIGAFEAATAIDPNDPPTVFIPTVLSDAFGGVSVDPALWTTLAPFAASSVTETAGHVELKARGYLVSAEEYAPSAAQPLTVSGEWTINSASDFIQILTRSDATPTGAYGETDSGIEVYLLAAPTAHSPSAARSAGRSAVRHIRRRHDRLDCRGDLQLPDHRRRHQCHRDVHPGRQRRQHRHGDRLKQLCRHRELRGLPQSGDQPDGLPGQRLHRARRCPDRHA